MLFARAPRLGHVKTRMLPCLDPGQALALHRALLEDSLSLLRLAAFQMAARPLLALSDPWEPAGDPADAPLMAAVAGVTRFQQRGKDLGERLLHAFRSLFRRQGRAAVVIFGADSPTLPPARLASALALLESEQDLVLGPAEDGGFYLIGARRIVPGLFAGIPWGTSQVFEATLRAGRRSGLRVALLPPWYDVDRPEDLGRLRDDVKSSSPFRPERTASFLEELARSRRPDARGRPSERRPGS